MTYPITDHLRPWRRGARISVRVWRMVAGVPQWLFTYAGAIDEVVLDAVMQHVRRLTDAVPGDWTVEVVGSGLHGGLLHAVRGALRDLRRLGLRPRLAHRRSRSRPRLLLSRAALAPPPTTLLH